MEGSLNLANVECITELSYDQRSMLVKQVRRWGDLNTDAILDPKCKQFSVPSIDGFIGYRVEAKCAVIFGDPLCAVEDQLPLVDAFHRYCRGKGLKVVYVIVSEQFARVVINQYQPGVIQFGHRLVLDPCDDPMKKSGSKGGLVRKKVKRAVSEGVVVNEYLHHDPALEGVIEQMGEAWLQSRKGPQVYIAGLDFFNDREGKRWFYAMQGNSLVGCVVLNETQGSSGWLLNNLIITPEAPQGTSELLVTSALKALEMEKCHSVVVGPVISLQVDNIVGLSTFSTWVVRMILMTAKKMFRLDGQTVFWDKFQPKMEPSYLILDKVNTRTIKALLRALNVTIKR